jgi:peptidoglycan/LPS O-acetylase OafA/YrhL
LKTTTSSSSRTFGLDLFRAIAILLVVMSHGGFIIDRVLPGFPYISLIDGVELFFVLSGFLIGTILIRNYEENDHLGGRVLISFWKRRWFRTLPNYYLILMLNIIFVSTGLIKGDINQFNWKFLFFLQNFNTHFTDFFWESWSLTVEEWFYILTPLTIAGFHLALKGKVSKKWMVFISIAAFIILPLLYRISISAEEVDRFWYDVKFRKVVLTRLDAIMYGVFFAWIRFYYHDWHRKLAWPLFMAGVILVHFSMDFAKLNPVGFHAKTWYFSVVGLGTAMMLPLADRIKTCNNYFGKAIEHISLISYSMYLINLALVAQVIEANFWPADGYQALLLYTIYWTVVILASTVLYRYFEKPMTDLRDKTTSKTEI